MISRSRRIGALPSTRKRVRWSPLVITLSPIRMRSPGFSSTFSAMTDLQEDSDAMVGLLWLMSGKQKTAGLSPRRSIRRSPVDQPNSRSTA
jgi:hypothetical protein